MQQSAVKIRTEEQTTVRHGCPASAGKRAVTVAQFSRCSKANGGQGLADLSLRAVRFGYIPNLLEDASKA